MELDDKKQFLSQCPPFSSLDNMALERCLKKLRIRYEKAGNHLGSSEGRDDLFLLRTGSLELKGNNGLFIDRLSSGGCFGFSLNEASNKATEASVSMIEKAIFLEDSLVYCFPHELIEQLSLSSDDFAAFFQQHKVIPQHSSVGQNARDYRLNQQVQELMVLAPLCTHSSASISDTARKMSEVKVSSILIMEGKQLLGILTDRDLRSRVLGQGVEPARPVSDVMTSRPKTILATQSVYEAQLLMMMSNIHHLPVVDEKNALAGIITLNDFIRAQNSEPIYMIQAIHRAKNRETLYQINQKLPDLICKMIRANVRAEEIGRIITSLTDCVTKQLIFLATKLYGLEPCEYAWVVFGSQARQDQMLGSDQDNGLILADDVTENERDYFKKMAEFVNEGLDKSGLKYCPGGIMAMTDKWRQPLSVWQQYFTRWIREPEPEALMHASIFYDIRHVHGQKKLTSNLMNLVLDEAKKNTIFQACMSANALRSSPPLGFFKTFVLEKDGNHNPVLDLKLRGTVPIIALVRLFCLAKGIREVNTNDRLKALAAVNVLSEAETRNLHDAHEFIASLRLESQSKAVLSEQEVSNNLNPNDLSPLVRHQLKDAFSVVADAQRILKTRFGHGVI